MNVRWFSSAPAVVAASLLNSPSCPISCPTPPPTGVSLILIVMLGPPTMATIQCLEIGFDELFPLFALSTPDVGGLGWNSMQIGKVTCYMTHTRTDSGRRPGWLTEMCRNRSLPCRVW